jgi:hypothetical protein
MMIGWLVGCFLKKVQPISAKCSHGSRVGNISFGSAIGTVFDADTNNSLWMYVQGVQLLQSFVPQTSHNPRMDHQCYYRNVRK